MKYYFFLLIVSSCLLQTITSCFFVHKYAVYVVNNLPPNTPPLFLHCASKDDDLGNHTLPINQHFRFAFCKNAFATLFFCRFRWNGKDKALNVYDSSWKYNRCQYDVCYYALKSDGVYFSISYPPKELTFLSPW